MNVSNKVNDSGVMWQNKMIGDYRSHSTYIKEQRDAAWDDDDHGEVLRSFFRVQSIVYVTMYLPQCVLSTQHLVCEMPERQRRECENSPNREVTFTAGMLRVRKYPVNTIRGENARQQARTQ